MENKYMKYNVGDRVLVKSIDWYNVNKDEDDNVVCFYSYFDKGMSKFCNKIVTIKSLHGCPNVKAFRIIEDDGYSWWSDDMIEGLVEEETLIERVDDSGLPFNEWLSHKGAFHVPDGYELKNENGNIINTTKIVLEKKKKEYPKTYAECCRVLGISEFEYNHTGTKMWYSHKLMATLDNLILCRDAYWKIAGEEMGLGKPWKPKLDNNEKIYYIHNVSGKVYECEGVEIENQNFAFPTPEMRDAFKKNFDPDIEICKELL